MKNPIEKIRGEQTRSHLAQRTGVPYATLSFLEKGLSGEMSKKTAVKIAEFSQKSPAELQEEYRQWKESLKQQAA